MGKFKIIEKYKFNNIIFLINKKLSEMNKILCLLFQVPASANKKHTDHLPKHLDLNDQIYRQVVVDRQQGQYLGHSNHCLLEDGKTILCVYPKGHGRGEIRIQEKLLIQD